MVAAATDAGIEVALDFAIQCSPDHPWLVEHPEWFERRPDGTLKYAENPPKRYQDIYNVNSGSDDWAALWDELRAAVGSRGEDPEAARSGGEDGLEGHVGVGVAERARCLGHGFAAVHAAPCRRAHAERVEQLIAVRLVVRAADPPGRGDHGRQRRPDDRRTG